MNDSPSALPLALARCRRLTAGAIGLWLLLAAPAHWLAGSAGLEGLTYAALLCLVPGYLVFLVMSRDVLAAAPTSVILLGSGLRMLFVLFGFLIMQSVRRDLGFQEFTVWLLPFYLVTLLLETQLVLKSFPQRMRNTESGTLRSPYRQTGENG